jgi:glycosyltransferase involved in cell wall biosynthesis
MKDKDLKVCFISPEAYPLFNPSIKANFGGAEVQMTLLSKELAKKENLDIHFIVADYGQKERESYDGVKVWTGLNFKDNKLKQVLEFFMVFNKVNADVYVQRTLTFQSALIGLYCRISRKKFVYMVAHDREVDGNHQMYNNFFGRFFIKLNFLFAHRVVVQNEYEKSFLEKQNYKQKVLILKKGLNLRGTIPKTNKKYDAIWVGRSERFKRPKMFLRLVEMNRDLRFLMICAKSNTAPRVFHFVKNKAKKLKNLVFLEFVENEEIHRYLAESKIYIFSSKQEGDWPMVVLEAAASKLPILSYDLNYDCLIDRYRGGVLCKGNFDLMNSKLIELIANEDKRKKMGENAYKYIEENHNIEVNAKKFLKIITNEK